MKILNTIRGLTFMILFTRIFKPKKIFKNKRVAIIGAADSAFEEEKGNYINEFDYIIRQNKAVQNMSPEKTKFLGNRTDILFHSLFENNESGGGKINFSLFAEHGVRFLVSPLSNLQGIQTLFAYFKRNNNSNRVYILNPKVYDEMTKNFGKWIPTVGYASLFTVLNSNCKEIYITGFTFFKTPYADNYRDHVKNISKNNQFIKMQGRHNPDLELQEFVVQLEGAENSGTKVILDSALLSIVKNFKKNEQVIN